MDASHRFDGSLSSLPPASTMVEGWQPSFSQQIKDLRLRYGGKQMWLASAIGCTGAAVSFWESGKRLPQAPILFRIVTTLTQVGAPSTDLANLRRSWRQERLNRMPLDGDRPHVE